MCTPELPKATPVERRNGLDYEPKKTNPPDYSNVPDVRSWQMSPFSHERFDLNEIQIAEKKGLKGKAELEELKQKLGYGGEEPPKKEEPKCPKCEEREKADLLGSQKETCAVKYLYQPYGPILLSTASYKDVGVGRNKLFCVSASTYSDFQVDRNNLKQVSTPFTCSSVGGKSSKKYNYIPYGPTGNRSTTFNYVPMGPSFKPKL